MNDENDKRTFYIIETVFYHNTMLNILKRYFLYHIDNFIEKGYMFSHIDEINILTVDDKMCMLYDIYIKHPMQAIELKINMIIAEIHIS